MKPKVLCVDDEPNVLAGMQLNLRKDFEVLVAEGGDAALAVVESTPDLAVILCDMRMPRMNGAALLTRMHERYPDVTRVLLTGQADLESAIGAINDGHVFRFLTKPCDRDKLIPVLHAAVAHHQLVVSEKVLLQQTLQGAVHALVEVLALTAPQTFGRANRVAARTKQLATKLGLAESWQLEMAASLQYLGTPQVADQILSHIPRLERIREILLAATHRMTDESPVELAGAILRLANDADAIEQRGVTGQPMMAALRHQGGHPAKLVTTLQTLIDDANADTVIDLPLDDLKVGMKIDEDLFLNGALLVSRGYVVTSSFLARVRHFAAGAVKDYVRVRTQAHTQAHTQAMNGDQPRGAISK